jgi:hypothetical protein
VHAALGLRGTFELVASGSVSLDAPDAWVTMGWQASLALRAHPLGRGTPWYLGGGAGILERDELAIVTQDQRGGREYLLVLTGMSARIGRTFPFVQVEVLDPFPTTGADLQVYVGVSYRLY